MMDMDLEGAVEFERTLDEIIQQVAEATLGALNAAEEVLEDEADRLAPKKNAMTSKVIKKTKNQVIMDLGPDRENWTMRFFETGATGHEIHQNLQWRPLTFEGASGELIRVDTVNHPGMAARPFLRPALDGKGDEAMEKAGEVFWEVVKREGKE